MNKKIENFIGGKFQNSKNDTIPIYNPQEGNIIAEVINSSNDDLDLAIEYAVSAYQIWSKFTLKERAEVFYEFRNQLIKNLDSLSKSIVEENGKTLDEAEKSVKGAEAALKNMETIGIVILVSIFIMIALCSLK